jgi:conjugal transfer/entry exclusion protein
VRRREVVGRLAGAGALLLGASLAASPAWALFGVGDIVFDPANYVQTLTTALNAVKQTWAQYEQLRQQILQVDQQAQQLRAIDPSAAARALAGLPGSEELRRLAMATTATADLAGSIQTVRRRFVQRLDEAKLANRSWADYERQWQARLARRDQAALARVAAEKAADEQVARDFDTARALGERIAGTAGVHEAQQLMNLQLNRLLQQNAFLNQQIAKFVGGHEAQKLQAQMEADVQAKDASDRARAQAEAQQAADTASLRAWAESAGRRGNRLLLGDQ